MDIHDVMPSAFTSTEYTLQEVNDVWATDFYTWAGRNNVQYINNTSFVEGSPFTYNYARSTDRLNVQNSSRSLEGDIQLFLRHGCTACKTMGDVGTFREAH